MITSTCVSQRNGIIPFHVRLSFLESLNAGSRFPFPLAGLNSVLTNLPACARTAFLPEIPT